MMGPCLCSSNAGTSPIMACCLLKVAKGSKKQHSRDVFCKHWAALNSSDAASIIQPAEERARHVS